MIKRDKQVYAMHWQGIDIELTYCPSWSKAYYNTYGDALAHLECRAIYPHKARLPITETGYRSHFVAACHVEAEGGPVAYLTAWLDEAAQSADWQRHLEAQRQPMLFDM